MKEYEIRPKALLDEYIRLSIKDSEKFFSNGERRDIPCVACGSDEKEHKFNKSGFDYAKCLNCCSLYQTPRPDIRKFENFYKESESSKFWADKFYPSVAEVRRKKIIAPKVKLITEMMKIKDVTIDKILDVGAGYGIFLEEWKNKHAEVKAVAIEPSSSLASKCRRKGFEVEEAMAEDSVNFDEFADLVVCFEVLEHVDDPLSFLKILRSKANHGGHVLLTTLCIDGFDLQILGKKSNAISPPFHINFISIKGFEILFKKAGFKDIDISTPGKLDVDIVKNAIRTDPKILDNNPFLKPIINNDSRSKAFQEFLSSNQLSSHVWALGRK